MSLPSSDKSSCAKSLPCASTHHRSFRSVGSLRLLAEGAGAELVQMERVLQLAGQGGGCGCIVLSLACPVISSFRHFLSFQWWIMIWRCWFYMILPQGPASRRAIPTSFVMQCHDKVLKSPWIANALQACYSHTTWTLVGQRKCCVRIRLSLYGCVCVCVIALAAVFLCAFLLRKGQNKILFAQSNVWFFSRYWRII